MIEDALANGEWVRDGLIWRWVQNEPEPEQPRGFDPADMIACPTCHARMTEPCKSATGAGASHASRLVPRVCGCGGPVRPREPMCGFCRADLAVGAA